MRTFILFAQNDPVSEVAGGILSFMMVVWIVGLVATAFWLWMLIDALVNEPTTNDKILWFLVIFFLHVIGAIIYFAVRRSGRSRYAH
jgi:hypothetical protein